jgi:DNA-binding protein WhiA
MVDSRGKIITEIQDFCTCIYCMKALICGLFWKCGYLSIPHRGIRLEFVLPEGITRNQVERAFNQNEIQMFYTQRGTRTLCYTTAGDNIERFLVLVGATTTVLLIQDILITRDLKNVVNRGVNCEVGNLRRSSNSSAADLEAIQFLISSSRFDKLSDKLRQTAMARLEYPDLTIRELGLKMKPSLTKAGVFHRLKKLRKLAETERKKTQ